MGGLCSSKPKEVSLGQQANKSERIQAEKDNNLYVTIFDKKKEEAVSNKSPNEIEKLKKSMNEEFKKLSKMFASSSIITRKIEPEARLLIHSYVSQNKLPDLHKILEENNIQMVEELSMEGFYWDILHYAVHFNHPHLVEYLILRAHAKDAQNFKAALNATTREGWNALMIAIVFQCKDSFEVLVKFGGWPLDLRDRDNRSVTNLAYFYSCTFAINKLKEFGSVNEIPLNNDAFKESFVDVIPKFTSSQKDQETSEENNRGGTSDQQDLASLSKNSKAFDILKNCVDSKAVFSDKDFPQKLSSITNNAFHNFYDLFEQARWMRPHQLFKCDYSQIKLFDNIDPNDIKQGCIGICYFLSILSALAEFPDRIKRVFNNSELNKYGVYSINFYFQGVPEEIIIDDSIPCYHDKIEPFFAKPNGKELWVLLLEKAWAKCFGNYTVVEYEVVDYAMEDILGAPALGFWANKLSVDDLWKRLFDYDTQNFIVSGTSIKTATKKDGLVASHAYTIISAYKFDNGDRVLKLRNPWGNFEWSGKYSEDSDIWNEEMKEKVSFAKADDGVFFMTIEEFHNWFPYVSVSFINESFQYQFKKVKREKNHAVFFKLTVSEGEKCRVYLRIHQKNERFFRENHTDYNYSQAHFSLYGKEGEEYFLLGNGSLTKIIGRKSIFINNEGYVDLKPGSYILRAKVLWETNNTEFVVSSYSSREISFEETEKETGHNYMLGYFQKKGSSSPNRLEYADGLCVFTYLWHEEHCILYYENSSENEWAVETILSNLFNARLGKKHRKNESTLEFKMKPNSKEIILVKRNLLGEPAGFNYKVKPPV